MADKFDASKYLSDIHGKDYLEVKWRLVWFREDHPDWGIETEVVERVNGGAIMKATVKSADGKIVAQAHKMETKQGFADYLEKAETGAVGRALAMCGYGTQFTADELAEGERIVDAPLAKAHKELGGQVIEGKNEKITTTKSPGGPDVPCPICQSPMVEREAKKGDNKGKFWGCSKYPECKGSRDHNWTQEIEKDAENRINIKSAADDTHAEEIPTEDLPF
jgi:hypothetical protein